MQSDQQSQQGAIIVELRSEDPETATISDIAFVADVRREVQTQLSREGYTVLSAEAGQKGLGDFFVQVQPITNEIWQRRDEIGQAISAVGILLYALFQGVAKIVQLIIQANKKREQGAAKNPCKITVEVDGVSITIESDHFPENDAALLRFVQDFAQLHPSTAQRASAKSRVRVQTTLPNRVPRRRTGD